MIWNFYWDDSDMNHRHKKSILQSTKGFDCNDLSIASFRMLSADSDIGYGLEIMSWMLLNHKMIRSYWRW